MSTLKMLQQNIVTHQQQQRDIICKFIEQSEARFKTIEQTVEVRFKAASDAATLMNQQSAKFQRLGRLVESTYDHLMKDSDTTASLSQAVSKMQLDVVRISRELQELTEKVRPLGVPYEKQSVPYEKQFRSSSATRADSAVSTEAVRWIFTVSECTTWHNG